MNSRLGGTSVPIRISVISEESLGSPISIRLSILVSGFQRWRNHIATASFLWLPKMGSVFVLRFQTEPPPAGEKVQAERGAVRKNIVLSCMPDVVPVLLHFRPRLLSVYASLAVRFSAGTLLRLSPGHGCCDPLSWQSRFGRYPIGRIFSCYVGGKMIPSLGRAREQAKNNLRSKYSRNVYIPICIPHFF